MTAGTAAQRWDENRLSAQASDLQPGWTTQNFQDWMF
jgi:hypothetical protein